MRILLTFVTLVSAVLVPCSSLAPALLQDASGSSIGNSVARSREPAARLNPVLGILPIGTASDEGAAPGIVTEMAEADTPLSRTGELPAAATTDTHAPRMVCENGVCHLVDDTVPSPVPAPMSADDQCAALRRFHATQIRLQVVEAGWQCSCSVPVSSGSRVLRHFEGTGATGGEAVEQVCVLIDEWLQARQ